VPELTDIVCPFLVFFKGFRIEAYLGFEGLGISWHTSQGLKSKPYDNSFIIDAVGKKYLIINVTKLGLAKPYFDILLFDPNYRIKLELAEQDIQLTVAEFKDLIFYSRRKEKKRSKRFDRLVSNASTYAEIIHAVSEAIYGPGGDYPSEDEC